MARIIKTSSKVIKRPFKSIKERCNSIETNPFDNRLLSFNGWFSSDIKGLQLHEIKDAKANNRPVRNLTVTKFNTVAVI